MPTPRTTELEGRGRTRGHRRVTATPKRPRTSAVTDLWAVRFGERQQESVQM